MNARKYNVMSWHVQVSISYGETLMLFQWDFISMYNLKTKLQAANIKYNILRDTKT